MSSMKLEIGASTDGHSGGSGEEGSSEGKAPSEFLAECLSASLRRQYGTALRYCRLILRYEPRHRAARALLPTLQTRAATATAIAATDTTRDEDAAVDNVGDSSASATDSSYSAGGAERSRSESRRLEQSQSDCRLEDDLSDSVSELDLESEVEGRPLEDLDTYTSTSASSLHEVSDSSGVAECDDNGNCMASDIRNDNAPLPAVTETLPLQRSHGDWPRDTLPIALDNDLRPIKDYQLRKSCAH